VGIGTPLDDESPEMASTKKGHPMRTRPDDEIRRHSRAEDGTRGAPRAALKRNEVAGSGLDRKGRREHLTHRQRSLHREQVG